MFKDDLYVKIKLTVLDRHYDRFYKARPVLAAELTAFCRKADRNRQFLDYFAKCIFYRHQDLLRHL